MIEILFKIEELPLRENYKSEGSITKKSISSYAVTKGKQYFCSCRTYEQAYYVKNELQKVKWDKKQLQKILEDYPIFYTKLLELYRYITRKSDKIWILSIPSTKSDNGFIQHVTSTNLEALLHERDFLISHNWDYDLLIECIDDELNPYFDVVLPPYPERKIRNNRIRKTHKEEIKLFQKLLLEDPSRTQIEIAEITGINEMNIRNWLHNYNMKWFEFKNLVLSGEEDLFKVMKLQPLIFQPDLSPNKPYFKGYIHKNCKSKNNPYQIIYKKKSYGTYPTRDLAELVRDELIKVDWDVSKLKEIQKKYGYTPYRCKNNIYPTHNGKYVIRKNINKKRHSYGVYSDLKLAEFVRDELERNNWDETQLDSICEKCEVKFSKKVGANNV